MTAVENATKPYLGLKLLMEKHGYTQQMMANELSIDKSTFNQKLNRSGGRDFYLSEANLIAKKLGEPISKFFYS
ncbi:helix-turn-helix transcriptional regulator [Streptococcus agalactiae]|uniref:DNA-binding protein n=1 Tax=Streptococcus agalactiae TaxID=1311 RepID=A0A0H1VP83_STRAG|nr:helix-turn-helix transcriptional regulator [Streptococcus agalactiae]KLL32610.1 DNA-binding protein [Streptococcus agalactiae]KLL45462.1 DNA-binding protein [Streptococcus agalactiae]KLL82652.1 DNA-binding protein [Streptococcus agalactiae]HEN5913956.1 helix-turn-helix transcriptional regulator [Streptococcus agalactiae]